MPLLSKLSCCTNSKPIKHHILVSKQNYLVDIAELYSLNLSRITPEIDLFSGQENKVNEAANLFIIEDIPFFKFCTDKFCSLYTRYFEFKTKEDIAKNINYINELRISTIITIDAVYVKTDTIACVPLDYMPNINGIKKINHAKERYVELENFAAITTIYSGKENINAYLNGMFYAPQKDQ